MKTLGSDTSRKCRMTRAQEAELEKILFNILPNIVENTLVYTNINTKALDERIKLVEDQEFIRGELKKRKL